jgi:hypothetical protein
MKRLVLAGLLALAACGDDEPVPPDVTGHWSMSAGSTCGGTMDITGNPGALSGVWSCGTLSGSISGTVGGDTKIALTFSSVGYNPSLVTGIAGPSHIDGKISGSGFNGETFTGVR